MTLPATRVLLRHAAPALRTLSRVVAAAAAALAAAASVPAHAALVDLDTAPAAVWAYAEGWITGPGLFGPLNLNQQVHLPIGIDRDGATAQFGDALPIGGVGLEKARIPDMVQSVESFGSVQASTRARVNASVMGVQRVFVESTRTSGYESKVYALSYWHDVFETKPVGLLAALGGAAARAPQTINVTLELHETLRGSAYSLIFMGYTDGPTFEDNYQLAIRAGNWTQGETTRVLSGQFTATPGVPYRLYAAYYAFAEGDALLDASQTARLTGLSAPDGFAFRSLAVDTGHADPVTYAMSAVVPEPSSWALLGAGLLAVAAAASRAHRSSLSSTATPSDFAFSSLLPASAPATT